MLTGIPIQISNAKTVQVDFQQFNIKAYERSQKKHKSCNFIEGASIPDNKQRAVLLLHGLQQLLASSPIYQGI